MAKLTTKEQIMFAKQLCFLLKAGISLKECLVMIEAQFPRKIPALSLSEKVSSGRTLYSVFADQKLFPGNIIELIRIGEESALLYQNLEYCSRELQKKSELGRKTISALIYPLLIACATVALSSYLLLVIFPKIQPLLSTLHTELPLSTRMLIGFNSFLKKFWILIIAVIGASTIYAVILYRRNQKAKQVFDFLILKVPLIGNITKKLYLCRITRNIGTMMQAGLNIDRVLESAAQSFSNIIYKNSLMAACDTVRDGGSFSRSLSRKPLLFPPLLTNLIASGEVSGNLAETMLFASEFYESEVSDSIKRMSGMLEPVLMALMGLIVGFISLSIISPIYEITRNIQH